MPTGPVSKTRAMDDVKKLSVSIWDGRRSIPVYCHSRVPEGVRPAMAKDLFPGRPVLYQVRVGPDAGSYYEDFVRAATHRVLLRMLQERVPVYVRK